MYIIALAFAAALSADPLCKSAEFAAYDTGAKFMLQMADQEEKDPLHDPASIISTRTSAAQLDLGKAKTYLDHGCLDQADAIYRDVLSTYLGAAYTPLRDLARVGIDDVREARRK